MPRFSLPAGWYRATITELVRHALPPLVGPLTAESAWKYVYAVVMWAEEYQGQQYMHILESNRLRTAVGRTLADRAADFMRRNMGTDDCRCDPFALVNKIGEKYSEERARQGYQPPARRDPNVTGAAFETALQVVIGEVTGMTPSRTPSLRTLQGFELAPLGYHSKPDLILFGPRDFRLLISTKWTLRKERIGTYLHEAYFYKNRRPDLQIAFAVSEFSYNILRWLSQDPLADRVYHVNKAMLLDLYDPFRHLGVGDSVERAAMIARGPTSRAYQRWLTLSERVFDLTDLFRDIEGLRDKPEVVLDPGAHDDGEEEDDDD